MVNKRGSRIMRTQKGVEGKLDDLIDFLRSQKYIVFAYLFGSVAKGKEGKLSDLDLAVFMNESLSKREKFDLQLKLISEITSILKTDKVDLVVMNDAPLLLNYNIIKHGKLLKDDERERIRIETNVLSSYLDRKYYVDRHTKEAIKRIAGEGLL